MTRTNGVPLRELLGPLRRVVSQGVTEQGTEIEHLECGHILDRKNEIVGPTNSVRRRCRFCRDETRTS